MEFRLLGVVEVLAGGTVLAVGPPQRRAVLAALLVDAGRPVPISTIIDRVWDEPPDGARDTVYAHVARLRQVLRDDAEPVALSRRSGGYALDAPADRVDLHRFRQLATGAQGRPAESQASMLVQALDQWRGSPLGDVAGGWAARYREGLLRERLAVALRLLDLWLVAGEYADVVRLAGQLLVEYPLAEPLHAALIRALAATGRRAEALDCYATLRAALSAQLGTEPGPDLQRLHHTVLRADRPPSLPAASPQPTAPDAVAVVPAQLPPDVPSFVGRDAPLRLLDRIGQTGGDATAPPIVVVTGGPGVGKTALILHWAHRVRNRYPDGQIYVNLRGYDPERPLSAAEALDRLLTALGVTGPDIPFDVDAKAARYRTATADRRVMIVLDNAASMAQVHGLVPGTGSCMLLVTSRASLAGIVAGYGAHRLELGLLPSAEAHTLLHQLIGPRAAAEAAAVETLADLCARLPLALRVAAEQAIASPGVSLADLVSDLADQHRRLDLLDAEGDPRTAVTAVFSWSLRHLPPEATRLFRLLGLHPGLDLDTDAAAALAGTSREGARRTLDRLVRAHLVHLAGPGRYGMHDLLRAYALGLNTEDRAADAHAAQERLWDHYLAAAAAAMNGLYPTEAQHRPPGARHPPAAPSAAKEWLAAERLNLVAVVAYCANHGSPAHAVRLAATLYRYLAGGHPTDALTVHAHARDAARLIDDPAGEAAACNGLGTAYRNLGHYPAASEHYTAALTLYRRAQDPDGEALVLNNMGVLAERLGQPELAGERYRQALTQFRHAGDQIGEARVLNNLGLIELRSGRVQSAATRHRLATDLSVAHGDQDGLAHGLTDLGLAEFRLGQHEAAAEHHRQALELFLETGNRNGAVWALNGLGEAAHARGDAIAALTHHTTALDTATDIGARDQQARAHLGLGDAHRALNEVAEARTHYDRAVALYTDLGLPDAEPARQRLTTLHRDVTTRR